MWLLNTAFIAKNCFNWILLLTMQLFHDLYFANNMFLNTNNFLYSFFFLEILKNFSNALINSDISGVYFPLVYATNLVLQITLRGRNRKIKLKNH